METVKIPNRKLRFGEILLLGDIFKGLKVKEHVEYLIRQRKRSGNKKTLEDFKIDDGEVAADVILYIIENINNAKEPIFTLLSSYMGIELKNESDVYTVELLDGDVVFEVFEKMWKNGLPEIIQKIFKEKGTDFLAKSNVQKS